MPTVDIPGDPGGLDALAGQFESAANDINAVRDRVATNGLDGEWSGQAADAFRSTLHRLPGELATVGGAFGDAMGTIRSFAGRLAELQQQARWYEEKLEESERDLQEANSRHDEATESLRSANRAQASAADPVSLHAAKQAVERGESMVRQAIADAEDIGGQVSQLNNGADSIRREYEEAIRSCCSALDAACPPGESMWSGLRHGFDDMTGGAILLGGAAWRGADRGAHDAEKDFGEAGRFALHEFDEHWEQIRAGLVAVGEGVAIATLMVLAGALVVGSGGLATPLLVLAGAGLADAAATEGGDEIEAARGNELDRKHLFGDTVNTFISLVGFIPGANDAAKVVEEGDQVTSDGGRMAEGSEQLAGDGKAGSQAAKNIVRPIDLLQASGEQQAATLGQKAADEIEGVPDSRPTGIEGFIEKVSTATQPIVVAVTPAAAR